MQEGLKITLHPFKYPDLTIQKGQHLPNDMRAFACWYYYTIAQAACELIGDSTDDQIIYEGERWMDKRYEDQAQSVAQLYGLSNPGEFLKFRDAVKEQAEALGLPTPKEQYMNPPRGRLII